MDASPIDCIFTVSRATARTTAYLRCRRARGHIIHCKYAVVLFGGRARARRSEDGTFSAFWRLLGCSQGPQEKVSKIRGATKMATSSIHCIFTMSRAHLDEGRNGLKQSFKLRAFLENQFSKSRSIDGSNHCILRVDRECVERIHRAYAVAMALPSPRPRAGWKKAGRRGKRDERRENMAASSIHWIFTVPRDHLEKVLKIRGGHENDRQLDSLHIDGVPWPRR